MDLATAIVIAVTGLAAIAGGIMTIWVLLEKANKKFSETVNAKIDKSLAANNAVQEKEIKLLLDINQREQLANIERVREEIKKFKEEQDAENRKSTHVSQAVVALHMEQIKKHVREVHKQMRKQGFISDQDMAYVDKVYPHYKEIGGNSDISAKVAEMHRIYDLAVVEQMDEARKNKYALINATEETQEKPKPKRKYTRKVKKEEE